MSKECCLIGLLVGVEADSEGFDLRANPVRKTPALCPTDEKAPLVQSVQMALGAAQVAGNFVDSHSGGNSSDHINLLWEKCCQDAQYEHISLEVEETCRVC